MYHNIIQLPKSYYENPKRYKWSKIALWKQLGVIYDDFDDLYEIYMNTMNCSHCTKPFITSRNRHLDHDHITGKFRKILCNACNNHDSYLKYPSHLNSKEKEQLYNEEYYNERKEELNAKRRQKLNCFFCSKRMSKKSLTDHYKKSRCPNIKPLY
jgi:hypothetical protein